MSTDTRKVLYLTCFTEMLSFNYYVAFVTWGDHYFIRLLFYLLFQKRDKIWMDHLNQSSIQHMYQRY